MSHQRNRTDIYQLHTKLLVSCPSTSESKGGLFYLDLGMGLIQQVFEGNCRGFDSLEDGYLVATNSHGILEFDSEFKMRKQHEVSPQDLHGLKIGPNELAYVVETAKNTIGIYQMDPFERVDEIRISEYSDDQNHINDLCIKGDSLYLSMFSMQGEWRNKEANFDGVIAEYDLHTKRLIRVIKENLQLPHSVIFVEQELFYCESMRLNLSSQHQVLGQFGGYTRGLAYDGRYFYIGQSEMRHLERILSEVQNVSVDGGIHIFDPQKRVNRFLPLPARQVYEIRVLEGEEDDVCPSLVDFTDRTSAPWLSEQGWHEAEEGHRWMSAGQAGVFLKKEAIHRVLVLDLVNGYPNPYQVTVYAGETEIGQIEFAASEQKHVEIKLPPEIQTGVTEIRFVVPHVWSPSQEFGTLDSRSLGVALVKAEFRE